MCCLCLVSERSFLRNPQPFLKKEKKSQKKVKKKSKNFKVAFLDFFGLTWLPGFQALLLLVFQASKPKKTKKISKTGVRRVKVS